MLDKFKPTWKINSIYDLTPNDLKKHNIDMILTDLDNTLIAWNKSNGTKSLENWIQQMRSLHIPIVVITNNSKRRTKIALKDLKLPFISRALKPFGYGLRSAIKHYNVNSKNVVMIGDQILTDILAANIIGIKSILVKPLVQSDAMNTVFNRFVEKKIEKKLLNTGSLISEWRHSLDD